MQVYPKTLDDMITAMTEGDAGLADYFRSIMMRGSEVSCGFITSCDDNEASSSSSSSSSSTDSGRVNIAVPNSEQDDSTISELSALFPDIAVDILLQRLRACNSNLEVCIDSILNQPFDTDMPTVNNEEDAPISPSSSTVRTDSNPKRTVATVIGDEGTTNGKWYAGTHDVYHTQRATANDYHKLVANVNTNSTVNSKLASALNSLTNTSNDASESRTNTYKEINRLRAREALNRQENDARILNDLVDDDEVVEDNPSVMVSGGYHGEIYDDDYDDQYDDNYGAVSTASKDDHDNSGHTKSVSSRSKSSKRTVIHSTRSSSGTQSGGNNASSYDDIRRYCIIKFGVVCASFFYVMCS